MRTTRAKNNRKAKKAKPKRFTDKERVEFARRHWDEQYGNGAAIAGESDKLVAAADIPDSSMKDDTSQSQTLQPTKFHGHTNPSASDHTQFSLTLSPIVSESDKTFFLNIDSE